jgi:hypothetical protein
LFRRIGKFIEDIAETIKRERGNLKIIDSCTGDSLDLKVRPAGTLNYELLKINASDRLGVAFVTCDLKDETREPQIKGEQDHLPLPSFFSEEIVLEVELNSLNFEGSTKIDSVAIESVELKVDTDIENGSEIEADDLSQAFVLKNEDLNDNPCDLRDFADIDFDFYSASFEEINSFKGEIVSQKTEFEELNLKNLDSEFSENQKKFFHMDEEVVFKSSVSNYDPEFDIFINDTISTVVRFPIRRPRASKNGYALEEIKRALTFIIERYESKGKLKIIGIYKNVPIYSAQKLTFSKDKQLNFYYKKTESESKNKKNKKPTTSKPFMLDVLVVKSKEGKYHVGPIIRTT